MQRQTNVLNLFVEFRFQLFNMKTLFYFELRISAGMIENLTKKSFHIEQLKPELNKQVNNNWCLNRVTPSVTGLVSTGALYNIKIKESRYKL